jgi:3-deoxy-7-phosphoheptulonate synthase
MTTEAAYLLDETRTDPAVDEILGRLPAPDYPVNYQPEYPDLGALGDAIAQMRGITPVTTPEQIMRLRGRLALLTQREACDPLITLGYCAEPIDLYVSALERATGSQKTEEMVMRVVGNQTIYAPRERGQYAKPRSAQFQRLPDGSEITAYMGDLINDSTATSEARQPDPQRLVAGALQAAEFEEVLTTRLNGRHLPAAHEALLLAYEEAFAAEHDGQQYGLSGDMLWIGERTRQLGGAHMAFARRIQNPIGVKLGPSTTPEYLEGLQCMINPAHEAGRLVLMVRAGNDSEALERITRGIKAHNKNAVVVYDIHGSTETLPDGRKHRSVERTVDDIRALRQACGNAGLRLHGVHLEMAPVDGLQQCTNRRDQRPTEAPRVDPLFSRLQAASILLQVRDLLPRAV